MNYFEHHIGDYDEATAHLTAQEDGIYSRMIRKYYATEKPLPGDIPTIQRLVRAHTVSEKKVVTAMLAEFFKLETDGYHQARCDADIAKFHAKSDKAKASAQARWTKHAAEVDANVRAYERNANASTHFVRDKMRTHGERNAPRARTSPQSPVLNTEDIERAPVSTDVGTACRAMRARGLQAANPSDPRLRALLDAGASVDELADAAAGAVAKGKGFAYALAMAEGRRRDAANVTSLPAAAARGGYAAERNRAFAGPIADIPQPDFIDEENPHVPLLRDRN